MNEQVPINLNLNPVFDLLNPIYGQHLDGYNEEFGINCKYLSENEAITKLRSFKEQLIIIFSLNCQSIHSKFDEIVSCIDKFSCNSIKPSVLACQELWANTNANFDVYNIEGYNWHVNLRKSQRGGGVGLLVQKHYKVVRLFDNISFKERICESVCIKCTYNNFKFVCLNTYRPPNQSSEELEEFFEMYLELLDRISALNLPFFVVGDINLDLFKINENNSQSMRLLESLNFNGILNTITKATRITKNTSTLIDIFGVGNLIPNLMLSGVLTSQISDHLMLINAYRINNVKKNPQPDSYEKRLLGDDNINSLNDALFSTDWSFVLNQNDVDIAYNNFITKFLELYNISCPRVTVKKNLKTQPQQKFMNNHLLRMREHKHTLHDNFLRERTRESELLYNSYRNSYNRSVRRAKLEYYRQSVRNCGKDSKKLWRCLKDMLGINQTNAECTYLEVGDRKIEGDQAIANEFNSYFSQIGTSLKPEIPTTEKLFSDYLPPPIQDSIFFEPLYPFKVINLIRNIRPKRSTDINDVSMFLISRCADVIAQPLSHVYNLSLQSGVFPSGMKISKIIVLHKSGSLNQADNHRGISLIDNFSKPLEKHVCDSLVNFLDEKNFFNPRQFGFRKGISTYHNVLDLSNMITQCLSRNNSCLSIFLDIRKCFDMIPRNLLFEKLRNAGIRGLPLRWFQSYYSNRRQKVFFKGLFSSTLEEILIGVLQGSVLGPILFLVFINDLANCSPEIFINLFADDALTFMERNSLTELIELAKEIIPRLTDWYNANELLIHPLKTKVMAFTSPRENLSPQEIQLKADFNVYIDMNNAGENFPEKITKLRLVDDSNEGFVKHLGVSLDTKLKFSYHLKKVYTKISKIIYSMRVMRHLLDKKHLKVLYSSYVKANIEYCCILFTACPAYLLNPIIKIQKSAVRIIENLPSRAHTAEYFKSNGILPFNLLIKYNVCRFMYRYLHNLQPEIFNNTWEISRDRHRYNTRNVNNFAYAHGANRNFLLNSPFHAFPTIFNNLPNNIKSIENEKEFNKKCFTFFLNQIDFT